MSRKILSMLLSLALAMGLSTVSFGAEVTNAKEKYGVNATEKTQTKTEQSEEEINSQNNEEDVPQIVKRFCKEKNILVKSEIKKAKSGEKSGVSYNISKDDFIEITDINVLAEYAKKLKNDTSAKGRLMANIEFPQDSTSAILCNSDFTGEFDGNGHTLNIKQSDGAIFKNNKGTIKDLKIIYNTVQSTTEKRLGVIVNTNEGRIENCISEGNTIVGLNQVGGIAGRNIGTIIDCIGINYNAIFDTSNSAPMTSGGIVGDNGNEGLIENCISKGTGKIYNMSGDGGVGGIAGWNSAKISSCITEGSLNIEAHSKDYTGGITGYNSQFGKGVDDCLVTGDAKLIGQSVGFATGGIVGKQLRIVSNCFYNASGTIKGSISSATGPVIGVRETGQHGTSKYNTDKTSLNNGLGTPINNIYWLDKGDNVKLLFTADPANGFTCAGRYFYYGDNQVTCRYDGTISQDKYIEYTLNESSFTNDVFTMPKKDSKITANAIVRTPISNVNPSIAQSTVVYDKQSHKPSTLNSDNGELKEGEDYRAIFLNSTGQMVTDCIGDDTYTMKITGINKYISEATLTLKILKADPNFIKEPVAKTLDYTGKDLELVEEGQAENGTILYKHEGGIYSTSIPTGKNAGKYPIKYMIKGDSHYNDSSEYTITAEIKKANPTVTKEPTVNDITYDKTEHALVSEGECEGGTLLYSLENNADSQFSYEVPTKTDAGTYEVYYMVRGDENHNDSEIYGPITVTIAKAKAEVASPKAIKLKYNDKEQELITAGVTNDGTFMYSVGDDKSYSEKIPTRKRVGTFYVYWKVVGDENHEDYISKTPIKVRIKATGATVYKLTPKGKKLNVVWNQTFGADGYDVFFAKCGKKIKLKKSVSANTKSIIIKGLKKKGCYKVKVRAWCMENGKKVYVKSYPLVHTYMVKSTKRYTVPKKVTTNVPSITLAEGKTFRVTAKVVKKNKKKKLMPTKHSPIIRYFSLDKDIVTIDDSGLVTAKSKGNCVVYAYATNGKYKAVNVTVK